MYSIFFVAIIIVLIGIALLVFLRKQKSSFGTLSGNRIYQDTTQKPGETLYAKTTNLVGRPDYLIREGDSIIPIEVKTGKTPTSPYESHTMQLMAYCLLVEENFGTRPEGGIIRYEKTKTEFKIRYTKEAEESLRILIEEITLCKQSNTEFQCTHPAHNF